MGLPIQNLSRKTGKLEVLKKRSDFLRLRAGKKYRSRLFTLQSDKSDRDSMRFGLTVTTKVGNAVIRNRIKRRLRDAARQVMPGNGQPGYDYVLIARKDVLHAEFSELRTEISAGLDHMHSNRANVSKTDH